MQNESGHFFIGEFEVNGMYFLLKRSLDIFLAITALTLMLPVMAVISLAVIITSGTPVFYVQERVGKNWKPFKIIKFRSMVKDADKIGCGITSNFDSRITPLGRILRKTKLDELPQLINVLKGDMSLIGPRPELLRYANHYKDEYSFILNVKPGITDYASVRFKNEETIIKSGDNETFYLKEILPVKIRLYKKYIREMGAFTDFKILIYTVKGLFI